MMSALSRSWTQALGEALTLLLFPLVWQGGASIKPPSRLARRDVDLTGTQWEHLVVLVEDPLFPGLVRASSCNSRTSTNVETMNDVGDFRTLVDVFKTSWLAYIYMCVTGYILSSTIRWMPIGVEYRKMKPMCMHTTSTVDEYTAVWKRHTVTRAADRHTNH